MNIAPAEILHQVALRPDIRMVTRCAEDQEGVLPPAERRSTR